MKTVFLDRDGVVVVDKKYQYRISDMKIHEGAVKAIARLNKAGFLVIVVSNQSGVARGIFTETDAQKFNNHLVFELAKAGARVDGIYYCPHLRGGVVKKYCVDCDCRKPKPGMLIRAAKEHGIQFSKSWMVGDKVSDVAAGKAMGCRTVFIGKEKNAGADFTAEDLNNAANFILARG